MRINLRNKVLSNSIWMILEKVISIFGLIFVTSYVAKYIGPANFGKISYVASIFIIIQAICNFGSEYLLFRRVSQNPISGRRLIHSTAVMRHLLFFILSLGVLFYLQINSDHVTFIFGIATAVAYYFATIDVVAVYNNATLNSKINTICNVIGLVTSLLIRYVIVLYKLDILFLSLPIILVTLVPYLLRRYLYRKEHSRTHGFHKAKFRNKLRYSRYMFMAGIPLAISSVSVIIYARITQFVIMHFGGDAELGIFSVASQLATAWMFITTSIITSYYSKIYAESNKDKAALMVARLHGLIFMISVFVIFNIVLFGKWVVHILYGEAYETAYPIMLILCVNSLFSAMVPIVNKYIVYDSGYAYLSKKTVAVAVVTIPIAIFLTKLHGVEGAAFSAVATEFLSLTIFNYFFKSAVVLKIQISSLKPSTYKIVSKYE